MFNVQGSELIFLLLIALVVLGPDKLPDAVRKFTKTYAEFKKVASGFQDEFRQALDEPIRELRETANVVRDATKFDLDPDTSDPPGTGTKPAGIAAVSEIAPVSPPPVKREAGLNFGSANPRRQTRVTDAGSAEATPEEAQQNDADPAPVATRSEPAIAVEDSTE